MALSGSLNTSSYDGRYYQLSWTATQNASTNKTTVSWTLKAVGGNVSWYAERTLKVVLAGTTVFSKSDRVERTAGTIKTGTIELTHNSDGTKSFSASIQAAVFGTSINCEGSKTFTLDKIARISTLSVSNGTLGVAQTLKVTRYSTNFTHTISVACGTWNGLICDGSKEESISYTAPLMFANEFPNASSVSVTFEIETFDGNKSIGFKRYTKTFAIPSTTSPTFTYTIEDADGYYNEYGGYIQSLSSLKFNIDATGSAGATIKSYKTTFDGMTYTSKSFETSPISKSGSLPFSITVTDSRGRSAFVTVTNEIEALPYEEPKISYASLKRCNSDGTTNSSGSYLAVSFNASVSALEGKNSAKYHVQYKKKSDTNYTSETISDYTNEYEVLNGMHIFPASSSYSYEVILEVEDDFTSNTKTLSVSSSSKSFSILKNQLGFAFGKVAELAGYLEVNFNALFYKVAEFRNNLVMDNGSCLKSKNTAGYERTMAQMNADNEMIFGAGSYDYGEGATRVQGYNVNLDYDNELYANGKPLFGNNVLWSSSSGEQMPQGKTITLSELISKQRNGIVLVFSGYESGVLNYRWNSFYIPKYVVAQYDGQGHAFTMFTSNFSVICNKYLYIYDNQINGNGSNEKTGTTNGVTYNNAGYVLRYVIGV